MHNYIFIGGTYRGFNLLQSLIEHGHIPKACYILKEDAHEVLKYSKKIRALAVKNNIVYFIRKKLEKKDYAYIRKNYFDFAVICGWRTLIDTDIMSRFKFGLVAAHDSLLPKYRGFAPLNWAIINGEKETGVTLFLVNKRNVDSGDIIYQKRIFIGKDDYAISVYKKITSLTIELYLRFFDNYDKGPFKLHKQNENQSTYTCKRTPEDGRINWQKSSREIFNLIRGLAYPYPGAYCYYKNEMYHIRKARIGLDSNKKYVGHIPGRLISVNKEGIEVLCHNGSIVIMEWENKRKKIVESPAKIVKSVSSTLQ